MERYSASFVALIILLLFIFVYLSITTYKPSDDNISTIEESVQTVDDDSEPEKNINEHQKIPDNNNITVRKQPVKPLFPAPKTRKLDSNTSVIQGRVYDNKSGKGIANVLVNLYRVDLAPSESGFWSRTDSKGRYEIRNLAPGEYIVKLNVKSFTNANELQNLQLTGGTVARYDFQMVKNGEVSGIVTDMQGFSITAASVDLQKTGILNTASVSVAKTDQNGRFELHNIPEGNYSITATHNNYLSSEQQYITVKSSEILSDIKIILNTGIILAGKIKDNFGKPILSTGEMQIKYRKSENDNRIVTLTTDKKGLYSVSGIKPGIADITLNFPGYSPSKITAVKLSDETEDIDFVLKKSPEKGVIKGKVVDQNNKPVEEALVILYSNNKRITDCLTDINGKYEFKLKEDKIYRIEVEKAGFSTAVNNKVSLGSENIDFILYKR
ncbi:MAG: carboxypeptidase-like regulatory domain-containing protein [Planctomycetota bacterium]